MSILKSVLREVFYFVVLMSVAWFVIHEVMGWNVWCVTCQGGLPW